MERVMAVRSLRSQLVAQACAHRKRDLQSNEMREMTLSLLRCPVKSRNFVYARAQKMPSVSRGLVVHARAQSAVNVAQTRGQKLCNFQGSCGVCKGSKMLSISMVLCMQGLKMQLFRESLMHAGTQSASISKILRVFKVLCMQGSIYCYVPGILGMQELDLLHFPGLCGASGLSRDFAARRVHASISRDFVHTRTPNASISRYFVHGRTVEMLQLQGQDALIAKDSRVQLSQNFACIIGAPVGFIPA